MKEKTFPVKQDKREIATTREEERYLRPPVDIFELPDALEVLCDMPGVGKENVDIDINDNILTIKGKSTFESRGEPYYTEFDLSNYYRQFELSEDVDQEKITAELKHGVLKIHLPKAERVKPKRIEVKVG